GAQYYRSPCPRRALRRLRHARIGAHALLPARDAARVALARTVDRVRVLGDQHRHAAGDPVEPAADRLIADVSVGLRRLLVGAQPRVYADRPHAVLALDADARRHDFRHRRAGLWLFRSEPNLRAAEAPQSYRWDAGSRVKKDHR